MKEVEIYRNQPRYLLAANLRNGFVGIVCDNVKEAGRLASSGRPLRNLW